MADVNILQTNSGDTEPLPGTALNPANNQPIDISNLVLSEMIWTVRDKKKRKLIQKKLSTGGIVLDPSVTPAGPNGIYSVILLDRDTHNLKGTFKYDLQVTRTNGVISTVIKSFIRINEDITQ